MSLVSRCNRPHDRGFYLDSGCGCGSELVLLFQVGLAAILRVPAAMVHLYGLCHTSHARCEDGFLVGGFWFMFFSTLKMG
jgi:hypothetical protein